MEVGLYDHLKFTLRSRFLNKFAVILSYLFLNYFILSLVIFNIK